MAQNDSATMHFAIRTIACLHIVPKANKQTIARVLHHGQRQQ